MLVNNDFKALATPPAPDDKAGFWIKSAYGLLAASDNGDLSNQLVFVGWLRQNHAFLNLEDNVCFQILLTSCWESFPSSYPSRGSDICPGQFPSQFCST
ncbi:hypothetical protein V6N11_039199 [Hibiscus sabdariffa]|uniref:Uncharacterized protein n=1 Tax=Hibiscus sabdariffa TaxID=183260 RepID=A0ABR2SMA5_9ROSI